MAIKQMETAGGDTKAMLKVIAEMEKKFAKLQGALADLRSVSSTLPTAFKQLHPGNVHNLDTPKEYAIWVNVEDFKAMYSLSRQVKEDGEKLARLKDRVKAYK